MTKEIRVYVLNFRDLSRFSDVLMPQSDNFNEEKFMDLAEQQGTVYSLKGFENAMNEDEFDPYSSYVYFKENQK